MLEEEFGTEGSLLFLVIDGQAEFVDTQSRGLGLQREGSASCCTKEPGAYQVGSKIGQMDADGERTLAGAAIVTSFDLS